MPLTLILLSSCLQRPEERIAHLKRCGAVTIATEWRGCGGGTWARDRDDQSANLPMNNRAVLVGGGKWVLKFAHVSRQRRRGEDRRPLSKVLQRSYRNAEEELLVLGIQLLGWSVGGCRSRGTAGANKDGRGELGAGRSRTTGEGEVES